MTKTFEPGKNAQALGIDVTRKFVVVDSGGPFKAGDVVVLEEDDGSSRPWFTYPDGTAPENCKRVARSWSTLAYSDEPDHSAKVAVHVPTRGQYDALMAAYARNGWHVLGDVWIVFEEKTCVRFEYDAYYSPRSFYEKKGYSVIPFDEAMRRLGEPVKEKRPKSPVEEADEFQKLNAALLAMGLRNSAMFGMGLVKMQWDASESTIITNQPKPTIMENVVQKIKDLALTKEDRALRAEGFEDRCGKPTSLARDMMLAELVEERWLSRRADVAKSLIEIAKEGKE